MDLLDIWFMSFSHIRVGYENIFKVLVIEYINLQLALEAQVLKEHYFSLALYAF